MDYKGMTVNESLYASGKLDKFEQAVTDKNVNDVVKILKAVDLKMESIIPILESLGLEKDNIDLAPKSTFRKIWFALFGSRNSR